MGQGAWYVRGAAPPVRAGLRDAASGRVAVLHQRRHPLARLWPAGGSGAAASRCATVANLGRLLRLLAGRHRPCGTDGRSGDERLGRRGFAARFGRGRRQLLPIGREKRRSTPAKGLPPTARSNPRCFAASTARRGQHWISDSFFGDWAGPPAGNAAANESLWNHHSFGHRR